MTCDACRGLDLNVAALPDVIDPKMSLRDAVGLFGVCPVCLKEVAPAEGKAQPGHVNNGDRSKN